MEHQSEQIMQYIGRSKVEKMFDCSGATVWRWVKAGKLPAPKRFSSNCVRWSLPELLAAAKAMTKGPDRQAEQPGKPV